MKTLHSILFLIICNLLQGLEVQGGSLNTNDVSAIRWSNGVTNEVSVTTTNMPAPSKVYKESRLVWRYEKPTIRWRYGYRKDPITLKVTYYDELTGKPVTTVEATGTRDTGFMKSEIIKP